MMNPLSADVVLTIIFRHVAKYLEPFTPKMSKISYWEIFPKMGAHNPAPAMKFLKKTWGNPICVDKY
jgi:hypothetical protein